MVEVVPVLVLVPVVPVSVVVPVVVAAVAVVVLVVLLAGDGTSHAVIVDAPCCCSCGGGDGLFIRSVCGGAAFSFVRSSCFIVVVFPDMITVLRFWLFSVCCCCRLTPVRGGDLDLGHAPSASGRSGRFAISVPRRHLRCDTKRAVSDGLGMC